MREILQKSAIQYRTKFLHQTVPVIWEQGQKQKDGGWIMEGLSTNYIRVQALSAVNLWNTISYVNLKEECGKYMIGEIEKHSQ